MASVTDGVFKYATQIPFYIVHLFIYLIFGIVYNIYLASTQGYSLRKIVGYTKVITHVWTK
jgi:hypothetical protein